MDSTSLNAVAGEEPRAARVATSLRSARTIHRGHDRSLRETVIALVASQELGERESPSEATLQMPRGRVRLTRGEDAWEPDAAGHVVIPDARHALEDALVLLTVVEPMP